MTGRLLSTIVISTFICSKQLFWESSSLLPCKQQCDNWSKKVPYTHTQTHTDTHTKSQDTSTHMHTPTHSYRVEASVASSPGSPPIFTHITSSRSIQEPLNNKPGDQQCPKSSGKDHQEKNSRWLSK